MNALLKSGLSDTPESRERIVAKFNQLVVGLYEG